MGESERKNMSQMAREAVEVKYHKLHHFLTEATWSADKLNERCLELMNKCNQTRISRGFALIVDDSGHRKSAPPRNANALPVLRGKTIRRAASQPVVSDDELGSSPAPRLRSPQRKDGARSGNFTLLSRTTVHRRNRQNAAQQSRSA